MIHGWQVRSSRPFPARESGLRKTLLDQVFLHNATRVTTSGQDCGMQLRFVAVREVRVEVTRLKSPRTVRCKSDERLKDKLMGQQQLGCTQRLSGGQMFSRRVLIGARVPKQFLRG